MRYIAAYLLSEMSGKDRPTADDIAVILGSVGVEFDQERADRVIRELRGKKTEDVINEGKEKLTTFLVAPVVTQKEEVVVTEDAEEEKKEVESDKKEDTEESDDDLGFGLFD